VVITRKKKELLKEFVGFKCEICHKLESDLNRLTIHHINRKIKGGNDSFRNLQVICERCHKLLHFREFR
jgi:5-methylcytosine-specific restriction endonuclease McrA